MPPCVPADRDGDGHIEAKELGTVMRIMGMEPTSEQLNTLVESIDVDGNGKIELPEFANMMARQMLLRDGKVRRAAASAHLTHSPHRGAHSLERLPGALWCCAVLCFTGHAGSRGMAREAKAGGRLHARCRSLLGLGHSGGGRSGGCSGWCSAVAAPSRAAAMVVLRGLGVGYGRAQCQWAGQEAPGPSHRGRALRAGSLLRLVASPAPRSRSSWNKRSNSLTQTRVAMSRRTRSDTS